MEAINETEKDFKKTLRFHMAQVQHYKDKNVIASALHVIPMNEVNIRATVNFSKLDEGDGISMDDLILMELMQWFKEEFFSWIDTPTCRACGGRTVNQGAVKLTAEDVEWGASRVEGFRCEDCGDRERFVRYNHPGRLLRERRGRCGEWANCFGLMLHALGREARLVFDFNDHVWVEVYSPQREEWLHMDPCESAFDTPLLYEKGWKKAVAHVMAVSPWEVQDVTWRYTTDFAAALKRRGWKCREEFVEDVISSLNERLQSGLTPEEREERRNRTLNELVQFLTPRKDDGVNYGGRTSGSLAWRVVRGEASVGAESGYVFLLSPFEAGSRCFRLQYSCAEDKYVRSDGSPDIAGWENCVFEQGDVFRKKELDWKKVYLCRKEGCERGFLEWRFDFSASGLAIRKVSLSLLSKTFETGKVTAFVWAGLQKLGPGMDFDSTEPSSLSAYLEGQCGFTLRVELSGGQGPVSWQHAQLFRQGTADSEPFPFELQVFLTSHNL